MMASYLTIACQNIANDINYESSDNDLKISDLSLSLLFFYIWTLSFHFLVPLSVHFSFFFIYYFFTMSHGWHKKIEKLNGTLFGQYASRRAPWKIGGNAPTCKTLASGCPKRKIIFIKSISLINIVLEYTNYTQTQGGSHAHLHLHVYIQIFSSPFLPYSSVFCHDRPTTKIISSICIIYLWHELLFIS